MNFYAYRLTGDPEADTKALRAWGLNMAVTNETGEIAVEINNPDYWLVGCRGYRIIANAGDLVVFSPDERSPMYIKVVPEVTADDAAQYRSDDEN